MNIAETPRRGVSTEIEAIRNKENSGGMMRISKQLRNSIIFCVAHILSAFSYEFIFFMMTIHVYNISKSPLNVGIFTAFSFFPKLFSPFYGVLVDQYSRKQVFGITTGIVGCLILLMGTARQLYWIYALWCVTSIFLMLIANVRTALMTEILAKDNFLWGNSVTLISLNLAKLLAPLSAGCIMAIFAKETFMYYTSGVYFFCMICTRFIKEEKRAPRLIENAQDVFMRVKEGVVYMLKHPTLKTLATLVFFWRLFLGLQVSLFVIYVKSYLAQSDAHYGLFMTMAGVGSLLGSVIGPWIAKMIPRHQLVFWGLLGHYLSFVCLGCIHGRLS